jgi:hypothetical protein
MIVLLVAIDRFVPRAPAPLLAVALGIAGAFLLNLQVFAMMSKSKLGEAEGPDGMHLNVEIAVAKYLEASTDAGARE